MSGPRMPTPDEAEYQAWLSSQQAPAPAPTTHDDADYQKWLASQGPQKPTTGVARTIADNAANGSMFGWGKKIGAVLASIAQHGNTDYYKFNLEAMKDQYAREQADHPKTALASTIAGAALSPLNKLLPGAGATTLLGRTASAIGAGAIAGGVAGAGESTGSTADQLKAAGISAAGGALLGGASVPVGALVGRGASALANRIAPIAGQIRGAAGEAASQIAPYLQRAGVVPATGRNSMLADVLPDLTRTVRSISPEARATIDDALNARHAQQLPTIEGSLEQGLGMPRGDVRKSVQAIADQQQAEAAPLYAKAYSAPDITDPDVLKTMQDPTFQQAYKVAQRIAQREGKPLPDLPDGSTSAAVAKMSPAQLARFQTLNPGVSITAQGIPVRGIDLTKRGLDDVIQGRMTAGNMGRVEARAIRGQLRDMLQKVDAASPDYAAARANYAGHAELLDAADLAGQHMTSPKATAADISETIGGMSPSEQAVYRRVAMDKLMSQLEAARGSATGKADMIGKFYTSVGGQAKVRALFPDAPSFDAFDQQMQQLADHADTRRFVTTGSQSIDKGAQAAEFAGASPPLQAALRFARHPWTGTIDAVQGALDSRAAAGAVQRATAVAPHLVTSGPGLQALLAHLHGAQQQAARDAVLRAMSTRAVAGSAGATAPMLQGLLTPAP